MSLIVIVWNGVFAGINLALAMQPSTSHPWLPLLNLCMGGLLAFVCGLGVGTRR